MFHPNLPVLLDYPVRDRCTWSTDVAFYIPMFDIVNHLNANLCHILPMWHPYLAICHRLIMWQYHIAVFDIANHPDAYRCQGILIWHRHRHLLDIVNHTDADECHGLSMSALHFYV